MSDDLSARPVRPEQWAIQAAVRADTIKHEMHLAAAQQQLDAQQQATVYAIEALLTSVHEATKRRQGWHRFAPVDRWRGTSVERAYRSLHAADVFLVRLLSEDQIDARIPSVVARVQAALGRDDPRRQEIDRLTVSGGRPTCAALQEAVRIAYAASDQLHVRVRNFRNTLIVSAAVITLLMGVLVSLVALHPYAMPFCFDPRGTESAALPTPVPGQAGQGTSACPSGDGRVPSSTDVLIVAGLGLLGGTLAATFAIRRIRGTSTPYDVPIATALLKVPSGALTAVVGIILLGGNFVPGLSELDNQRQILAYALVFGYAQQLATRFIDERAQSLLASVPSKDREGQQPTPSPAGPPLIREQSSERSEQSPHHPDER